jgi:hypothetical protein
MTGGRGGEGEARVPHMLKERNRQRQWEEEEEEERRGS